MSIWSNPYRHIVLLIIYNNDLSSVKSEVSNKYTCGNDREMKSGWIELSHATPFIDFHYNNSTSDYTSRIIEYNNQQLTIDAKQGTNFVVNDVNTVTINSSPIALKSDLDSKVVNLANITGMSIFDGILHVGDTSSGTAIDYLFPHTGNSSVQYIKEIKMMYSNDWLLRVAFIYDGKTYYANFAPTYTGQS